MVMVAADAFRRAFSMMLLLAATAVCLEIADAFLDVGGGAVGGNMAIMLFAVLQLHIATLVGFGLLDDDDRTRFRPNRSIWGVMAVAFILPIVLALLAMLLFMGSGWAIARNPDAVIVFMLGATLLFVALAITVFGPAIPASLIGQRSPLRFALRNSPKHIVPILWRMVVGPGVCSVLLLGLTVFIAEAGVPVMPITSDGQFDPLGTLVAFVLTLGNLFSTALAAAILCGALALSLPVKPDSP